MSNPQARLSAALAVLKENRLAPAFETKVILPSEIATMIAILT
jgi:hypothetical protein